MVLYTKELVLRTVTKDDVQEVARMWKFEQGIISMEDALKAIDDMHSNHTKNVRGCIYHLCLGVFESGDSKIIGWCGLDGKSGDKLHIFYLIDAKYRNKSYASQCASRLLSYAFNEAEVPCVNGGCDKNNVASFKVMLKAGMEKDGFEANGDPIFFIDSGTYRSKNV